MQKMSLHEAMYTQRAIRNFTSDPVSDEVVTTILDAAVRAFWSFGTGRPRSDSASGTWTHGPVWWRT